MDPYLPPTTLTMAPTSEIPAASGAGPVAVGAIGVGILFSLLSILSDLSDLSGGSELVGAILGLGALVGGIIHIVGVVSFLIWLHRASRIVHAIALNDEGTVVPTITPGWAVGWWFVPFANLIKPLHVMKELWAWSEPNPADRPGVSDPRLGTWWGLWMASNIASNASVRLTLKSDMVEASAIVDLIAQGLSIGAALLVIQVIRGLSQRLEAARGG